MDKKNVFNMGICVCAGYAVYATALDARVRGIAMASPYLNAADAYLQAVGSRAYVRQGFLSMASTARQKFFETDARAGFMKKQGFKPNCESAKGAKKTWIINVYVNLTLAPR